MSETLNKRLLITGASKRIGAHLVKHFANQGFQVVLHYHHSALEAEELAHRLSATGSRVAAIQADLSDPAQTEALIDKSCALLGGPIAYLINNASVFEQDSLADVSAQSWLSHMNINALAPLLLTKSLAANLPETLKGAVINIVDQKIWRLNPSFISYTASKAALWTLTQTCAQALAPNIRVNAIGPGPVLPNIHHGETGFKKECTGLPLEAGPTLDEIAECATFLFNSASVTGQMIALDGGQHLAWKTPDYVDE